jgi:MFS family permease
VSVGVSARLNARFGPRPVLVAGLVPVAAALALLIRLPVTGGYAANLLPTMLLVGGFGLAFPAMITLAMSSASDSDAGVTSGLVNTTQQAGAALGVAVLSTLAASRTAHLLATGTATGIATGAATRAALTEGYRLAFGVGAALALTALLVTVIAFLPSARRRASSGSTELPASPAPDEHLSHR